MALRNGLNAAGLSPLQTDLLMQRAIDEQIKYGIKPTNRIKDFPNPTAKKRPIVPCCKKR